ncbi:MAG: carboxymuconolactone decarboxylase family protein [Candidatus Zixiibacteriota bacterium]
MAVTLTKQILARQARLHKDKKSFFLPLLSAAIAGRDESIIELILRQSLDARISPLAIDETILQSHLFLGFPAMIETSRLFAKIHPRRYKKTQLPEPYAGTTVKEWNREGLKKIRRLYGPAFERLVPYINSFSPQILTWMINDGYGQVLSRPGLGFHLRELCTVATLTVTAYEHQLGAHIRGALNVGADAHELNRVITDCRYFCPQKNIKLALRIVANAVRSHAQTV